MQSEFMNDLNKALGDISSIRRQMARSTEFRGYGPATLAATGLCAIGGGCAGHMAAGSRQSHSGLPGDVDLDCDCVGGIDRHPDAARTRRIHSGMADEMIRMAVEQFLPSAAAGGLLTMVLVRFVPGALWMLPGMWQVIFSLGVFSSCRFLPRPMIAAGLWYLLTGLGCIALGDSRALSPGAMGVPTERANCWSRVFFSIRGKVKMKAKTSPGRHERGRGVSPTRGWIE